MLTVDALIGLILPWLSCAPEQGLSLCPAHSRTRRKSETLPWRTSPRTWRPTRRCWSRSGWASGGRGSSWAGGSKERSSTESLKAAFLLSTHLEKNLNGFHKKKFCVKTGFKSEDWTICNLQCGFLSGRLFKKARCRLLFNEQVFVKSSVRTLSSASKILN